MTSIILKYPISGRGMKTISMPKGSRLLAVQEQHHVLALWALTDAGETLVEPRTFRVLMTGELADVSDADKHVGTVQIGDVGTPFVLHVFEVLS